MATLKTQNFDLEFSYYDLNSCNEIEYLFDIKLNGKPFFNLEIISKTAYSVKNGKFIISDCWDDEDWLHAFFINILKTKKGRTYTTTEPPEWRLEVITWEDRRAEKEKSWEGKTVKTKNEQGEIIDVSYTETMKMFIPLWENNIEFKIGFPYEIFDTKEYTTFELSLTTTFSDLTKFLEDFGKEMNKFYDFFGDRIEYAGNGIYKERKDFKYEVLSLDRALYLQKRCAEWNNLLANSDEKILFDLLSTHIYSIADLARYLMESSVTEDLSKKVYALAETKLENEKDEEIAKKTKRVKTVIAIIFPKVLTNFQLKNALTDAQKEDIPEEIYAQNKAFYPEHLK